MKNMVFFDVDGTLNQTHLYAVPAYHHALQLRGRDTTDEDIYSIFGMSPPDILVKFLGPDATEEEIKSWRHDIKEAEFSRMEQVAAPFEGIPEALATLKEQGCTLAICSNAYPEHILNVLKVIGLTDCFDVIGSLNIGNNKVETMKNLMAQYQPDHACLVGDRLFDVEAADAAGIPSIGCLYGYAPEEAQQATVAVTSPQEIPAAVEELFSN